VIVKIGKGKANSVHILLEFRDPVHDRTNRSAKDDVSGNEFLKGRGAPRIPDFSVLSANQRFVVAHERAPPTGCASEQQTQLPNWMFAAS
jgi:hypothetical protein